jgi:hypothetical protein
MCMLVVVGVHVHACGCGCSCECLWVFMCMTVVVGVHVHDCACGCPCAWLCLWVCMTVLVCVVCTTALVNVQVHRDCGPSTWPLQGQHCKCYSGFCPGCLYTVVCTTPRATLAGAAVELEMCKPAVYLSARDCLTNQMSDLGVRMAC